MKKRIPQTALSVIIGLISISSYGIDDSIIFENIDSQKSTFGKIQESNNSETPVFHQASHNEVVVEDTELAFVSPTKANATTFDKEKVSTRVSTRINQKKAEKLAEEIRASEF